MWLKDGLSVSGSIASSAKHMKPAAPPAFTPGGREEKRERETEKEGKRKDNTSGGC
jgi:hypothetical protein